MKRLVITLFTIGLFPFTLQAQRPAKYHVYVIATNGKVVNKTFASTEELNQDAELRSLQIGGMAGDKFAFTPDESKHKAVLVEELRSTGEPRRALFQAWDGEAAAEIQKSMSAKVSPPKPPVPQPVQPAAKPAPIRSGSVAPKGFEKEILQELMTDGLIQNNPKVTIKLTKYDFLVNEEKHPESTHQKYIKLVESIKGEKLSDHFQFHYSVD